MRVRLVFSNGREIELPCRPEDFSPLLTARIAHEQPSITGYTFIIDCLYCDQEFESANPLKKYESASHRKLASLYRLPSVKHGKSQEK